VVVVRAVVTKRDFKRHGIIASSKLEATTGNNVIKVADEKKEQKTTGAKTTTTAATTGLAAAALFHSSPAFASAADAVPSAFAAYGHYLGLLLIVGSLATEKAILKPNMTGDELMKLVIADSVYGIAGVLVLYTGYLRVTQYGKGWEFYSHEPIFWFKMFLFAVMGSSSLFVTIKTITTFAEKQKSTDENETYISEKLATRMGKVLNGELLAVLAIPLAATTMSRGILFQQEMDWHLGAAPVALASAGLGFKYVKEALTWTED
jgi:putative membrane protein